MKKKIIYSILTCFVMLFSMVAFSACGNKNIKVEFQKVGLNQEMKYYVNEIKELKREKTKKGENRTYNFQILPGLKDNSLKIFVDNQKIEFQRKVQFDNENQKGEEYATKDISFKISNLKKDTKVKIDYSNCEVVKINKGISLKLQKKAKYASIEKDKLKNQNTFSIDPMEFDIKDIPENGKILINYDSDIYLFVEVNKGDSKPIFNVSNNSEVIEVIKEKGKKNEAYLVQIEQKDYQVFCVKNIVSNDDIEIIDKDTPYNYEVDIFDNLFNLQVKNNNLFQFSLLTNASEIKDEFKKEIKITKMNYNGKEMEFCDGTIIDGLEFNSFAFYLGNKQYACDDEKIDSGIFDGEKIKVIGKTLYIKIDFFKKKFNGIDNFNFSIYKNTSDKIALKTFTSKDLTKIGEDENKETFLLELGKKDFESVIKSLNNGEIKTGYAFFDVATNNDFLNSSKDFVSVRISNDKFYGNTLTPEDVLVEFYKIQEGIGRVDSFNFKNKINGEYVYILKKSELNTLHFKLGKRIENMQQIGAILYEKIALYINGKFVEDIVVDQAFHNVIVDYVLDASKYINEGKIDISFKFIEKVPTKDAKINLEKLAEKLDAGLNLYYSKDLSKPFGEWEKLTKDTLLTLNNNEMLFFVFDGDEFLKLSFIENLKNEDIALEENYKDFFGNYATIKDNNGKEQNIKYLTIDKNIYNDVEIYLK